MTTGQWLGAGTSRYWYDSGALSLDFAHAGDDVFAATDGLADWLDERFDRLSDDATERDLGDSLALRSAIHRLARALVDSTQPRADDVDTVNLFAATPDVPPVLVGGQRQAGRALVRIGQALSTIARDAVTLLSTSSDRIRECDGEDCDLVFYDDSRTSNRRWCSMQRCGNRAKVRAFRERGKA